MKSKMLQTIEFVEQDILKSVVSEEREIPDFKAGDTITIHYIIREGDKTRVQQFTGTVIQRRGRGLTETVTVRHLSGNVAVERIFPIYSPNIEKIEVLARGKVRRARLFYLRNRFGKEARVKRVDE
jgi:large subunit ribosomal protein L19